MAVFKVHQIHVHQTQEVQDLLIGAVEGGSNYWAQFSTKGGDFYDFDKEGYALNVHDKEGGKDYTLDLKAISKGLRVFAKKSPLLYQDFLKGDMDAETSDCFLQCCVFGEIVYG